MFSYLLDDRSYGEVVSVEQLKRVLQQVMEEQEESAVNMSQTGNLKLQEPS